MHRDVESRKGLVADEIHGVKRQRSRYGDPLELTTAYITGLTPQDMRREPYLLEQNVSPADPLLLAVPEVAKRLRDDRLNAMAPVQARARILEYRLDRLTEGPPLGAPESSDWLAVEFDSPRRRLEQAEHEPGEGRLSRPALPHNPQRLARFHGAVDPVDRDGQLRWQGPVSGGGKVPRSRLCDQAQRGGSGL